MSQMTKMKQEEFQFKKNEEIFDKKIRYFIKIQSTKCQLKNMILVSIYKQDRDELRVIDEVFQLMSL